RDRARRLCRLRSRSCPFDPRIPGWARAGNRPQGTRARRAPGTPNARWRTGHSESGLGKHQRTRASRIDGAASCIAAPYPLHELGLAAAKALVGIEPKIRDDDDVRSRIVRDAAVRSHRNLVPAGEGLTQIGDDAHLEE